MNGELNGMVEEPSETPVAGPDPAHNTKLATSEDCNIDVNNCETSISEPKQSSNIDNADVECSANGTDNDIKETLSESQKSEVPFVEDFPPKELEDSKPLENHCSNNGDTCLQDLTRVKCDDEELKDGTTVDPVQSNVQSVKMVEAGLEALETMESDGPNSIEVSSDESEVSAGPRAEDTVSINSDSGAEGGDDTSQESQSKTSKLDLVNKDRSNKQNGDARGSPSPEVEEIVGREENQKQKQNKTVKVPEIKVPLRRSSRAIKRKRYDGAANGDDDSDAEEVLEPYRKRSRPIVINDTKTLVEMAARQMKTSQGSHQKKEPTVVIIDTNSAISNKTQPMYHQQYKYSAPSSTSTMSAQSLYQSIVARGTTVTPVPAKANASTQSTSPQVPILPSLTDDMFVVEAPSFIVPYVYEKPSIKPFREFVDVLGNELAEQKAKEEKAEQEKLEKEKKEKLERGEKVENTEEESEKESEKDKDTESVETESVEQIKESTGTEENETDEEKKKIKSDKREHRKRQKDDDDMSWDGESSSDSEDELGSDEEDKTIVIKDKLDTVTDLKSVTDLTVEKVVTGKSDNYFDGPLGKFFMNIGLNLVQEYVQNDLLKQQNKKLYKEKKTGQDTKATEISIGSLRKNIEFSKSNNAPYSFPIKKCERCSFKSESLLVLSHHTETPHMKNNLYKCNYCSFEIRSPHDILFHMEAEHHLRGRLERAPSYHQCPNCPFEDNGKGKLVRHLIACAKKFKPDFNLSPPLEWEPPAKIPKQSSRSRGGHMMGVYPQPGGAFGRGPLSHRPRGRSPLALPARPHGPHTPHGPRGVTMRHAAPGLGNSYPIGSNNGKGVPLPRCMQQPSISITPLPRQQQQQPPPLPTPQPAKGSCVVCEICDGYIKDLEQLRNHMQWIHKVKIHPKMIYNRPPLNCQKCQFRFFTDQGLERHLLGSHGLVTSSMQEAANKGKDAGRCPVCGRIYQWKLLNHVSRDHSLTLKPAHLSYKCTVCTATFGMYKQFESHVYSAHSVVAKRAMDKTRQAPATATHPHPQSHPHPHPQSHPQSQSLKHKQSLLKPLKINDEITIIPQPVKHAPETGKMDMDDNDQ